MSQIKDYLSAFNEIKTNGKTDKVPKSGFSIEPYMVDRHNVQAAGETWRMGWLAVIRSMCAAGAAKHHPVHRDACTRHEELVASCTHCRRACSHHDSAHSIVRGK